MSENIQSQLGRQLREAREQRGLSIAQAAAETRILQRYLLALEEGDFHHLPGDVYARGFVRNYAQYLDLPIEEMVEMYRAERGGSAPIRIVPAAVPPKTRSCLAPSGVIVFFLVAFLAVAAYLVLNALGLTTTSAGLVTATPPPVSTPAPLATSTVGPTSVANVETPGPGQATTDPVLNPTPTPEAVEATPEAPLVVEVSVVSAESWMLIVVDGETRVRGTRQAGWSNRYTAEREVRVRAGNAGSVQVSVNGSEPQVMGQPWKISDESFRP